MRQIIGVCVAAACGAVLLAGVLAPLAGAVNKVTAALSH